MAIVLQSSQALATNHGVKVLTYGNSGLGKTMLTATAPSPVLISAESGLLSLAKSNIERVFGVDTPGINYNIPVIEIKTVQDLEEAHRWAQSSQEAQQFSTIAIDSISEIGEVVLSNAKAQVKDPRQAYGELMDQMARTIRSFRDLNGKHVYVTAKSEFSKDDITGVKSFVPSMPGSKLSQQIPYWFDEVFNINIASTPEGAEYRFLRTQPDLQYAAKDRSGCLEAMEMPNLTHIFNKILGGQ